MRHVALIGMMGSGKSTVGSRLAVVTGRDLVDLDGEIERREGRTIPEIFAEDGEETFRRAEHDALAAVLDRPRPAVIATGGGVVATPACRELLAERTDVVWLRAGPETLARRVGDGRGRPLLAGNEPASVVAGLAAERAPLYDGVADIVVDTDDRDHDEVVEAVLAALGGTAPTRETASDLGGTGGSR